jgi:hypothetical protein
MWGLTENAIIVLKGWKTELAHRSTNLTERPTIWFRVKRPKEPDSSISYVHTFS